MKQVVFASYSLPDAKNSCQRPHSSKSLNPRDLLLLILSHINLHFVIDCEKTCSQILFLQIIIPFSVV
jgi:hypothetical protein